MTSKQRSYPGVELKRHPLAAAEMAASGCVDRLQSFPTDEAIALEVIDVYRAMRDADQLSSPSGEWRWIFDVSRRGYQAALESGDREGLMGLLRNFFRNELSFGLVSHATFDDLSDGDENTLMEFSNAILLDVDTWLEFCDSPSIAALEMPAVGNPYGIVLEGTLILPDAPRHSYHARKLQGLMHHCGPRPVILEIGGGYGSVFWRLWNTPGMVGEFCYINCDLEETLFLFCYFALTGAASFGSRNIPPPKIKWALDGVIRGQDTQQYDLILVPASRSGFLDCGVDIAYNSNSLSEMAREDVEDYFRIINRLKPRFIFHQNSNFFPWEASSRGHIEVLARDFPIDHGVYEELYRAVAPWMGAQGRYREYLYARRDLVK